MTLSSPLISPVSVAKALAYDDAMLAHANQTPSACMIYAWTTTDYAVVMGRSNHAAIEVNTNYCDHHQIPVLRRCSGGGTVCIGPGCVNYSIVSHVSQWPGAETISGTNTAVMAALVDALAPVLPRVTVRGVTDLVVGDKKIAGHAQRRLRHAFLFHGTMLVTMDLSLVSKTLHHPSREPDYRGQRPHQHFIQNTGLDPQQVIGCFQNMQGPL